MSRGRLRQSLGANPESLVAQLALQYSTLNHCATWEAQEELIDAIKAF